MLVFDGFTSRQNAEAFAEHVKRNFDRDAQVFDSQAESDRHGRFCSKLDPPIVQVERNADFEAEWDITAVVAEFGGVFAGT